MKEIKKSTLGIVFLLFTLPPLLWFITILGCELVELEEWKKLLFQGAIGWIPYIVVYIFIIYKLTLHWFSSIEKVSEKASEEEKKKVQKIIYTLPLKYLIAEIIYALYGGNSALVGYYLTTHKNPPLSDNLLLVEISSQLVTLFISIPLIFILSRKLNSLLIFFGISFYKKGFNLKKQFLLGSFSLTVLGILYIILFYFGKTGYFDLSIILFAFFLIGVIFFLIKITTGYLLDSIEKVNLRIEDIIKNKKLDKEVEIVSSDEIGKLASSFNEMIKILKKTHQELELAKIKMENILNSQIDVVIVLDKNGNITKVNKAVEEILEYKEEELKDKHISKIIAEEDLEEGLKKGVEKALQGENILGLELNLISKEGKKIPFNFNGSPLIDKEGNIIGAIGIGRDLRLIRELMEKDKELAVIKAKRDLERKRIKELEDAHQEIKEKTEYLERFHHVMIDRELEMIRLKEEINSLLEELGRPKKYRIPEIAKESKELKEK